jgi:hypothetical protein
MQPLLGYLTVDHQATTMAYRDGPAINLEDLAVKYDAVNAATASILGKG